MSAPPIPNTLRGELILTLGGRDFLLRPTFNALAQTETMAGCGLMVLARRFVDGTFGLRDVVAVLLPALKDGEGMAAPVDLGEQVVADGLVKAAGVAAHLLAGVLAGRAGAPGPL